MKPYILRGALAGLSGAIAAVLTLVLLGEQSIRQAVEIEQAGGGGGDPMFTRTVQVVGGSIGVALYALLAGTVFGILFAASRHRLGAVPDWQRARRLAALAFVSVYLVPWLKYPPNPPAVGDPDTVNQRTISYVCVIGIAVVATILAMRTMSALRERGVTQPVAGPAAVALWLVVVGAAFVLLPPNPDEITVGAQLIWRFRLASLGGQAAFWAATGLTFGWLTIQADGGTLFRRGRGGRDRVDAGG